MIKKSGSKFVVTNKSGTKVLGTHPSKEKAQKQLAAIEISKAKHMKENTKRFKDFRNTLSESEYKETLTGYPNRSLDTDVGAIKFNAEYLANANAMLNALSKYTYLNPTDAFVKIKARLNVLMLDFPWTPRMWAGHGQIPPGAPEADNAVVGEFVLAVTRFGRVDGYDGQTGNIRFDGRAASQDGFQEFDLKVRIELGDDSMYRVTAKLAPKTEPVMAEEGVEVDGDALDEMAQTAARQKEMERKIAKQDDRADRAYTTKMNSPSHKKAKAAEKRLDKTEKKVNALLAQDRKEYDSPRTYGRSGKLVKRGSRHEVKEGAEQIDEMHKVGDTVKVPHKGKMVKGKIVRHDKGGSGKAAQHGGGYVVDVGEYSSITVPSHKVVKEELVGGQKKLDVNKNKKLDAQDFAMLRAKKKPVAEAKMKQWTPRLDKLLGSSRDAVRSKPKKSKILRKIKDGKVVSTKVIRINPVKKPSEVKEQSVNPEFTTGMPLITPEPSTMPKAPAPKAKKKQSRFGSY